MVEHTTDWGPVIIQLIIAVPAMIASIGAFIVSMRNKAGIAEVKKATNGIKDELVTAARTVGVKEGIEQGRAEAETTAQIAARLEARVVETAKVLAEKVDATNAKTEEIHNSIAQRRKDDERHI